MRYSPAKVGPLGDVALGGAPTAEAGHAAGPLWARLGAMAALEVEWSGPDMVGTTQERVGLQGDVAQRWPPAGGGGGAGSTTFVHVSVLDALEGVPRGPDSDTVGRIPEGVGQGWGGGSMSCCMVGICARHLLGHY